MDTKEIIETYRPKISEKDIYRMELVKPHKEGWANFDAKGGKPNGQLAECYRPIGAKQIMPGGFIKCGFYYGGHAKGEFRVWQQGQIVSKKGVFEGRARFMWWLNKEYNGTVTVNYTVDKMGVIARIYHEFGVDFI